MSRRLLRINELIKRELSTIIRKDVTFEGTLVGVSEVDVTPDLKQARVFVSVIGDDGKRQRVLALLEERRGLLQSRLSKRVVLKHLPHLSFLADDSIERGVHILSLLDQVEEESSRSPGTGDPGPEIPEPQDNSQVGEEPE